MNYSLTILKEHYDEINAAIFSAPGLEGAAYLLCNRSITDGEVRLLGRQVIPIQDEHYLVRAPLRLSIDSTSYAGVAKRAREAGASIIFVHSHPHGLAEFSPQDDREEPRLQEFFHRRVPDVPHGSLVISLPISVRGRIWSPRGWQPISRVRVIGQRFRFFDDANTDSEMFGLFDRQVRAFGPDIQRLLSRLHVAVVGAGGTGSVIIEQLARLGVGRLSIFDGDVFDSTNANRVYGSSTSATGRQKVDYRPRTRGAHMGLGTIVHAYSEHITNLKTARRLRECDAVFGCTDKHAPRGILVQLALRYLIPVIDTGVKIDSADGTIKGVTGRATTLLPGEACLFCRGRISSDIIRLEALSPSRAQSPCRRELRPGNRYAIACGHPVHNSGCCPGHRRVSSSPHRLHGPRTSFIRGPFASCRQPRPD